MLEFYSKSNQVFDLTMSKISLIDRQANLYKTALPWENPPLLKQ